MGNSSQGTRLVSKTTQQLHWLVCVMIVLLMSVDTITLVLCTHEESHINITSSSHLCGSHLSQKLGTECLFAASCSSVFLYCQHLTHFCAQHLCSLSFSIESFHHEDHSLKFKLNSQCFRSIRHIYISGKAKLMQLNVQSSFYCHLLGKCQTW